jgi:hypothetical protein
MSAPTLRLGCAEGSQTSGECGARSTARADIGAKMVVALESGAHCQTSPPNRNAPTTAHGLSRSRNASALGGLFRR